MDFTGSTGNNQSLKITIMQPKFTRENLGHYCTRFIALAVIFSVSVLGTFAQKSRPAQGRQLTYEQRVQEKLRSYELRHGGATDPKTDNDAGLPNRQHTARTESPQAVCATFTGSLAAGDATMPQRLFRGGTNLSSCAANPAFPGTSAVSPFVDTYTWTNTSGLTQCATITLTTTDVTNANIQHGVWNGSFNPAALATNYMSDPGSSTGTPAPAAGLTISVTINAGQTVVIPVWSANASTGATGTASNYTVTVNLPICSSAPCSGVPAPGNTISTVTTVCSGINFGLSLQNATSGSGVTYQWQVSTTGIAGTYSNIAGATNPTYTASQTVASCYRCQVTCGSAGGGTATSNPVCVALTPASSCYCIPGASDCTDNDVITRVRISTLDNSSTCGTGPPAGYTNYTTTVAAPIVYAGAPNPILVDKPTVWSEGVSVWIDYNQDGNFSAAERTDLGVVPAATGTLSGNINIPASALTGVTRMRVRIDFASLPPDACAGYTFGETEDYSVNIQPCVPVTITGNPTNASITCGGNASFTVVTNGSLPVYAWEYRTSAAGIWQDVPNAAPYSGLTTSTLTLTNVSQAYNGYQYRAVVRGGCSALDFSAPATLTVNQIVPVVTPASATICVGTVQQLSLTNTLGNTDLISEGFNTMTPAGWTIINRSAPLGTTSWFQGDPTVFPSQSGAANAYAAANYNNTGAVGQISDWFITPSVAIKNGDVLKFWSRKVAPDAFPDRMQVRMSTIPSTNVGATATSVGDFTTLLVDINPTEVTGVYPVAWTQYTVTISGLASPVTGNFAFRYFISNAGSAAANGDYIGIDNVTFTSVGGIAQGIWTGPAGTMWTNAGASTPYTGGLATTIYVNPTSNASYGVSFSTLTPCTSAVTTVPVNVTNPVSAVVNPVNKAVCVGGSTSFSASASGGPLTYQWQESVDGGVTYSNISGATSSTLSLTAITQLMNNNLYRCVITASPCGSSTTTPARLTVNPLPVVTISATTLQLVPGGSATFTATSTPAALNASSYSWTLNGSTIAGATGNTVSANIDALGTYQATVTDINGCVNQSNSLVLGARASERLWIYPNPNTGQFQVRLYYNGVQAERRKVQIFTVGGQLVTQKEFDMNTFTQPYMRMDFDLSLRAAGTYVVKVVDMHLKEITSGLVVVQ